MLIGGFQKSSLIDYPGLISAVVFTQGCNFRCPYCHNPELIKTSVDSNILLSSDILKFLKTRIGKLDGVVITGGEPTLHQDLSEFIRQIKDLKFAIKLDTNGSNPEILQSLLDKKLVNYIAMDIKAPIEEYSVVVCKNVDSKNVLKSIEIIKNSGVEYEFRTTVVKSQLNLYAFEKIGEMIKGAKKYYLQRFVSTKTLDEDFLNQTTYSDGEFNGIIAKLKKYIDFVELR